MNAALLLAPDMALILFGFVLRRALGAGESFWAGLEKLVYFVLFPALLFNATAGNSIQIGDALPLVATGAAAMGAGMLLGLAARPFYSGDARAFAAQYQCAFRFNSYIGLAAAGKLYGTPGVVAMGILVGAMVPLANAASVWMLARHGKVGVLRELARNPLIIATLAGLAWNAAGLPLHEAASQFFQRLAAAAVTLGLLAVGAALRLRRGDAGGAGAAWLLLVKLVLLPAAAWVVAHGLGLLPLYQGVAVMFAALPTASSAYILTVRLGGDGRPVAWLISASTLLAMLSMPLWVALLARGS